MKVPLSITSWNNWDYIEPEVLLLSSSLLLQNIRSARFNKKGTWKGTPNSVFEPRNKLERDKDKSIALHKHQNSIMWIWKSKRNNERWVFAIFAGVGSLSIGISIEMKSKILTSLRLYYDAVLGWNSFPLCRNEIFDHECSPYWMRYENSKTSFNK